jgi:protein-tyrosine phosphatase
MGEEPKMKVLFVCSGNICRSPMAAEYMKRRAVTLGLDRVAVDSAGLLGIVGSPASPEAVQVLEEQGMDLKPHRSRGLRAVDLGAADLVLVMTEDHKDEIERRYPRRARRVELLRAFEDGPGPTPGAHDLEDPMGSAAPVYRDCFRTIRACVDHLLADLGREP